MQKKKSVIMQGDLRRKGIIAEKEEFLEDEEHSESEEDFKQEIATGEKDEDVYTEEGREEMLEESEISGKEEGFARGAQKSKRHKK